MLWRNNKSRESKTPRSQEEIKLVTAGGRTFYLKKSGKTITAHRTYSDAVWDREDKNIYDLFNKRELNTIFMNTKLRTNSSLVE